MLRRGTDTEAVLERFQREHRLLGMLHHPGLYEAAVVDTKCNAEEVEPRWMYLRATLAASACAELDGLTGAESEALRERAGCGQ